MKLVILESPTKTKALKKYLGSDFNVHSSNGHISKLANRGKFGLGVDLVKFEPTFVLDSKKRTIVTNLQKLAQRAEEIFIATDPDREGEAIAFHLAGNLGKSAKTARVVFNEITKKAVLAAFAKPRAINKSMVESQFTRRIIDRMIGYRLSRVLQSYCGARSAGRVQSMALRLIANREKKITDFEPETSWIISTKLNDRLFLLKSFKNKKIKITTSKQRDQILKSFASEFTLTNIKKTIWNLSPPNPLTTSSLLQAAGQELGFSAKKTMFLAQNLYEGIKINNDICGLISYPRTDSQRINNDFIKEAETHIEKTFGPSYLRKLPKELASKKSKMKIQDAHEAIRITDIQFTPVKIQQFLTSDQHRLYELIYSFTLAFFMKGATGDQLVYELTNNNYQFTWTAKTVSSLGFTKILPVVIPFLQSAKKLPNWKVKQKIPAQKFVSLKKETKPPARYSEVRLIKELEILGIGRPSTFSSITSKLINWNYVFFEKKQIVPTSLGKKVNGFLQSDFLDFINENYTAKMESDLDEIALGRQVRFNFLHDFWIKFNPKVEIILDKIGKMKQPKTTDKKCPNCKDQLLQQREGRYGPFLGCPNYPKCRHIEQTKKTEDVLDEKCPEANCGSPLTQKKGRYGDFIGCSNYPNCKYIKRNKPNYSIPTVCPECSNKLPALTGETSLLKCAKDDCNFSTKVILPPKMLDRICPQPNCENKLVERKGRYGKFVACSGFPECKFIEKKSNDKNSKTSNSS